MRAREIVELAVEEFGWMRIAFPQIVLQGGVRALTTLTAAARLMCAKETYGIDNAYKLRSMMI